MDWSSWRRYFERNAIRALPSFDPPIADPPWRKEVARSLAHFQLGETGEGRIANEIDRVRIDGIDDDYRRALKLFVKEEGRHARILAGWVRSLGGELVHRHYTAGLFTRARGLLGVRSKLVVLFAAEVVGIGFYGIVAGALPRGPLADSLDQIADDEVAHLYFHEDFFRTQTRGAIARAVFRAAFFAIAAVACALVLVDHRKTLRALGVPVRALGLRYVELVVRVLRGVGRAETEGQRTRSRTARRVPGVMSTSRRVVGDVSPASMT